MFTSLIAHAESNFESIAKQSEQLVVGNAQRFKPVVEDTNKRIEKEAEFYKEIVKKAKASQGQHTEELSKQNIASDSIIDKIITNHKSIENLDDRTKGLIVFVSFSMPQELLWSYHEQLKNFGGRMVVRGLVDNSFKKTIVKLKLDEKRALVLDINPKLFEEYHVSKVPSIVISNGKAFDKFTGSVSLRYALESSREKGDAKLVSAKLLEEVK
jgi:conjugal transfer pilus assembly protein TrbC